MAIAQTASPAPQDKRGLGIESTSPTASQSDQTKSKEAKPELVLQTGYNSFFGATRLVFSPDGRLVAAGIVDKKLKVWDVTTNLSERELGPTAKDYSPIKFSHDGRLVALSEGYTIKLWDVATGRELPTLNVPNTGVFSDNGGTYVGFSDDGKKVATGGFGTQTLLWETETGKQLLQLKGRSNMAYAVAFSADGNQLSAGGRTRWDLRTARGLRLTARPSDKLFGMPSPDGKLLAMFAPNNSNITILETPGGRQLQTLARANTSDGVERVSFSPDGRLTGSGLHGSPGLTANGDHRSTSEPGTFSPRSRVSATLTSKSRLKSFG